MELAVEIHVRVLVTASYAQMTEISVLLANKGIFKVNSLEQVVFKFHKHMNVKFKDVPFVKHQQPVKLVLRTIS